MHLLIEKGVLTSNDALSVVQVVAEVQTGILEEGRASTVQTQAAIALLQRMYSSFEAIPNGAGSVTMDGENVHLLRPPLHGDEPHFPKDDD